MGWFDSIEHNRWLSAQMQPLIQEAEGAIVRTGFAHLTAEGEADPERSIDLAVTARMMFVFSLGVLMGLPGCRRYADHAVRSVRLCFTDPEQGGFFTAIRPEPDEEGHGVPWDEDGRAKSQYHNAFVILGAAAATVANRPGAHELLNDALHDQERHWIDQRGLVRAWMTADHSEAEPLLSMDVLVHTVEAYLAAAEATTDPVWIERAEVITRFVAEQGQKCAWRLPAYFDLEGRPTTDVPESFKDGRRVHRGVVTGRSMQWARQALHIRAALRSLGRTQPDYLMEMASELFERARVDAWRRNGHSGFAATVDADGVPLDEHRLQWVTCEGICAAVAMRRALLDDGASQGEVEHYEHCYRSWLDYLNDHMILRPGRWARSLDAENSPVPEAWKSRWDVYHAVQTLLMPRVPLWPPLASALSRGLLDKPEEPPADRKSWNFFHRR